MLQGKGGTSPLSMLTTVNVTNSTDISISRTHHHTERNFFRRFFFSSNEILTKTGGVSLVRVVTTAETLVLTTATGMPR